MHLLPIFCIISVIFTIGSGTFLNPYPKFHIFSDNGNSGEALYLTKYLENGDIETAQNLSLVTHPDISIESYAGYFTVDKKYNSNMFFWYFPAKENPENAPVLLWLQGGPGASSFFGMLTENGPFLVTKEQKLIPNEYSWHLNHNLIYIDNPVGAGYSFTESDDGYANNEIDVGKNLLFALQQFFVLFPKLQKNEFYASGESYAGKYIPALGHAIYQDSKRNTEDPQRPKINLKGLVIGNGLTDPINQLNFGDYFYQLGLIDTNALKWFVKKQNEGINCLKNRDMQCGFRVFNQLLGGYFRPLSGFSNTYNFLKAEDDTDMVTMSEFLQKSVTRRALHVGSNPFGKSQNIVYQHLILDFMDSVAHWVSELLPHYPISFYNGQLDIICAYPLTENFLKKLDFNSAEEFKTAERNIWRVDNEIAGYAKNAGNLTEVLVRNAGHMVPTDQPKWALDLILRFTRNKGFQ